ncbi:hypothetical protein JZ751_020928 [Albula glossodonta]|uniref:G-protein coupled receptors family 2 profile 2 domain-containing protein n=1 Tax=Albula glossodonta TaxID=121402 RepID=A0A8T2PIZ3_9TELE|nr:hypothetical protein JZ751_020928 [Albula glossodonta]
MWRWEGCQTIRRQGETECRCNHLTYFAILVTPIPIPFPNPVPSPIQLQDLKLGSEVDHLEALTYITSVGCAVSLCSCFCLIILLTKMLRRKAQVQLSIPIHRNLAVALFLLCTLFVLTGVVANIGSEEVCRVVGAALHYSLLCSFTWMGIEIFAAFWLVHRVMSPFPDHRLFILPAVLVAVLVSINDIYGTREIIPSGDVTNPYKMCWLKDNPSGSLVHYITNISYSAGVVFAGLVMLCLVLNKIQTRPEWSRNQASFLSIWGLSCLFGCTWSLEFLNFGSLSESVLFLFCAINSLQGFFLMLRFVLLEWMKKQGSVMERSSTGSTKQPMLLEPEKS